MRSPNLLASFGFAFAGLRHVIQTQRNFRMHIAITMLVLCASLILHPAPAQWAMLVLATGLVLICETFNTVIEALVDTWVAEFHPQAKIAKDAAAGAVTLAALTAVIVGILIFVPLIWSRLGLT
ncbi:MAG: diacylglycerol kinase family protein [Chloroflexi bacterium]|nr:diacylglycerol kinase family protein [Chloroflexota bacterium]